MSNNTAFDFFQSFMNQENITKSMKWMPKIDLSLFEDTLKETAENVTSAGQLISNTAQSIAKKSNETFQRNNSEMLSVIKESILAKDFEQVANCQQNYLKLATKNNISSAKEILDITSESSMEILNNIGKKFTEKPQNSSNKKK